MERIELNATTRDVMGKKVRFLRREGIIPIHLFGHNVESLALQCNAAQFHQVFAQAGKRALSTLNSINRRRRERSWFVRYRERRAQASCFT